MSKWTFIIAFVIFPFVCRAGNGNDYPNEVSRLGLQKLHDKSKWLLYCIHSDRNIVMKPELNLKDKLTFGEMPLKFESVKFSNDTVEFSFVFLYHSGEKLNYRNIANYRSLIYGVVFKGKVDTVVYYRSGSEYPYFSSYCSDKKKCTDRFAKPLQPEVIKYIKENKDKLDPWFRKQAIKRGVISE